MLYLCIPWAVFLLIRTLDDGGVDKFVINVAGPGLRPVFLIVAHSAVQTAVSPVIIGQRVQETRALHAAEAIPMVPQTL